MKNKKWLNYALGILLTLLILAVVAGAGFYAGMRQNIASLQTYAPLARLPRDPSHGIKGNSQDRFNPPAEGVPQTKTRDNWSPGNFPERRSGVNFARWNGVPLFFKPLLWAAWALALALLAWLGFLIVRKSGWRISFSRTTPEPAADSGEQKETKTE